MTDAWRPPSWRQLIVILLCSILGGILGAVVVLAMYRSEEGSARFGGPESPVSLTIRQVPVEARDMTSVVVVDGVVLRESRGRGGLRASALLPIDALYRLPDPVRVVTVKVEHGPAPLPCALLSIGDNVESADPSGDVLPELLCSLPEGIRAYAGTPVKIAIRVGEARNALTVPLTAVEGATGRSEVTVIDNNGAQERRLVTLGLNDGVRVQVLSGLTRDDRVLDPVPSIFEN